MLAKVGCWAGMIICIILGIMILDEGNELGLFIIIIGAMIAWANSWIIYGFGELVENVSKIAEYGHVGHVNTQSNSNDDIVAKIEKLKKWKRDGLISEKEYVQKMEELQ